MDEYQRLTIPQLRQLAVERGIQLGDTRTRTRDDITQLLAIQDKFRTVGNPPRTTVPRTPAQPVAEPIWVPVQPAAPRPISPRFPAQPITTPYPRPGALRPVPIAPQAQAALYRAQEEHRKAEEAQLKAEEEWQDLYRLRDLAQTRGGQTVLAPLRTNIEEDEEYYDDDDDTLAAALVQRGVPQAYTPQPIRPLPQPPVLQFPRARLEPTETEPDFEEDDEFDDDEVLIDEEGNEVPLAQVFQPITPAAPYRRADPEPIAAQMHDFRQDLARDPNAPFRTRAITTPEGRTALAPRRLDFDDVPLLVETAPPGGQPIVRDYEGLAMTHLRQLGAQMGLIFPANTTRDDIIQYLKELDETRRGNILRAPVQPKSPTRQPLRPVEETTREKLQQAQFQQYDMRAYSNNVVNTDMQWGQPLREDLYSAYRIGVTRDGQQLTINPIGYLMALGNINHTSAVLTTLGFANLIATEDVCYNLLWYLHNIKYPRGERQLLTKREVGYISGLTDQQLIELLGRRYTGPRDKASLLFVAVTGYSVHRPGPEALNRYAAVSQYPSANAWYIARAVYNIIDSEHQIISPYSPYVHIALQPESLIERVMIRATSENAAELIRRYGMAYNIDNIAPTNIRKFDYFMIMVKDYLPVLTRGANVPPVPVVDLRFMSYENTKQRFEIYTIDEIANVYEPQGTWEDRKSFIEQLRQGYNTEPTWAWRSRNCNNNEMLNVIQGELRGDVNKNDPNDPTISYGVLGNYSCYQVSELEATFREDNNGIFQFYNPDWAPNNTTIDKRTGRLVNRTFSIDQIRALRDVLDADTRPVVRALHAKILTGLSTLQATAVLAQRLRNEYLAMTDRQKVLVETYLVWLFYYGMWLRFWKGPGFPWPVRWNDRGGQDDFCTTGFRDAHAVIQQGVHHNILRDAADPVLTQWLNNLPLVDYNFRTGEARAATGGTAIIKEILDRVAQGRFCLANASDLVLRDAYFLITSIIDVRTEDKFNEFLQRYNDNLLALENAVVTTRLNNRVNERPDDVQVLLERQRELGNPRRPLPRLSLRDIGGTEHIDPELGRRLRFGE